MTYRSRHRARLAASTFYTEPDRACRRLWGTWGDKPPTLFVFDGAARELFPWVRGSQWGDLLLIDESTTFSADEVAQFDRVGCPG